MTDRHAGLLLVCSLGPGMVLSGEDACIRLCRRSSVEKDFSFSMSSRRRSGTPAGVTRMGSITAQQRAPFPEASHFQEQQQTVLVRCCPVRQHLPSCSSAAWRGALCSGVLPAVAELP